MAVGWVWLGNWEKTSGVEAPPAISCLFTPSASQLYCHAQNAWHLLLKMTKQRKHISRDPSYGLFTVGAGKWGEAPTPNRLGVKTMKTISVTVPETMPVYVSKLGLTREVNISKSIAALLNNGLKQKVNDAHANIKRETFKTEVEFVAAVTKDVNAVIEKIESGNWVAKGAPPVMSDEMMAAVLGVSVEQIRAMKAAKETAAAVAAEVPAEVLIPAAEKKRKSA
jgi:hypothetical protein